MHTGNLVTFLDLNLLDFWLIWKMHLQKCSSLATTKVASLHLCLNNAEWPPRNGWSTSQNRSEFNFLGYFKTGANMHVFFKYIMPWVKVSVILKYQTDTQQTKKPWRIKISAFFSTFKLIALLSKNFQLCLHTPPIQKKIDNFWSYQNNRHRYSATQCNAL